MSDMTVRGFPPGGTKKQLARVSDDGFGIEFDDPAQATWEDIIIDGFALRGGSTPPDVIPFGPSGGLYASGFNGGSTTEIVYGSFEIPHSYKEGTDLHPHIHWAPTTSVAGNVKWQMEYSIVNVDGTFGAPTTIAVTDATDATAWKHLFASFPVISGSGLTIGAIVMFRLFRDPTDAADTYGSDACLISFGIHYQQDTAGSYEIVTKGYP